MKTTIELWDDDLEDVVPVELPAKYEVCGQCNGHGTQCKLGAMTGSEWHEACHDDEDFAENYKSGLYDEACSCCKGQRVVAVVDEDAISEAMKARLQKHYDDLADRAEERRMEMRYQY